MLKIKDMNSNNVIRQGDSQPREYQLDTGNLNLNLTNKSATIRLMTADFQGIGYETTATVSSDNKISFRIEDVIPAREYRLEITVDDYVFPSRALDGQFNVDPSSHGQEVNIIQIIGKDEIVRDVKARVENELEPFLGEIEQAELDRQAQEEAREETHEKVKDLPEAFQNVIDETTGKDVISAPEIIAARRGKANLGEKIDELDFQLNRIPQYVNSRGQNLITNGTGLLRDNTNFSGTIFDGSDNYGSNGSFTYSTYNGTLIQDEFIPVDPSETYRFTYYMKANPYVGARAYSILVCYDSDGQEIQANHTMYRQNTLTELAQDLKPGDTKVYLNDVSNWNNGGTAGVQTHLRTITLWNYVSETGYQYPPLTYSRNTWSNMWDPGAINFTENSITLKNPWDKGLVVAGTKLSNGANGATYKYVAGANFIMPENWERYSGTISGIDTTGTNHDYSFHPGTTSIKIGWILNRDIRGGKSWLTNISFGLDTEVAEPQGLLNEATGIRLKYWAGSQAEYDAIGTYDLETVYDIW